MPSINFQKEKEMLLKILREDETEMLQRDYPFKQERNTKIFKLKQKGVSYKTLSELTGLKKSRLLQINKILKKGGIKNGRAKQNGKAKGILQTT
jgi:hypothetical protein